MRSIVLLALVAFAYGELPLEHQMQRAEFEEFQSRLFENAINKSSECIRTLLKNGDEEIGLPPLDPLVLDDIAINLDKYEWEHFKGTLELNSFKAEGHLNWKISELKIKPTIFPLGAKVTLSLDFVNSQFGGNYKLNTKVLEHSIEGAGKISGSATNFKLSTNLQVTTGPTKLKKLEIKPSLENIEFEISQLVVDGNDVAESINSNVNELLQIIKDNLDVIGGKLAEAILNILNKEAYTDNKDGKLENIIGAIRDCIQLS